MQSSIVNSSNANTSSDNQTAQVMLVSDKVTFNSNVGKFIIPTVTPILPTTESMQKTTPKQSSHNVINNDNLGASSITTSNYIELAVPKNLFYIDSIKITPNLSKSEYVTGCNPVATITYNEYTKGQYFIVSFLSMNNERPIIIGVIPS